MTEEELIEQYGDKFIFGLKFLFLIASRGIDNKDENFIIKVIAQILAENQETFQNENPALIQWVLTSMKLFIKLELNSFLVECVKEKYPKE